MKRFINKKIMAIGLAVAVTLGTGGAAFAYFTSTGSGTGAATVGAASNWTITNTNGSTLLYPDAAIGTGNILTDAFTVKNAGLGNQNLASLTIEVANSDGSAFSYQSDTTKPACTAADFSIGGRPVGTSFVDTSAPPAGTYTPGQTTSGTVTVQMIDNGANQDNCQNLTIPLYFTAGTAPVSSSELSIDPSPPTGSGGFYPNPNYLTDPTIDVGTTASLTVTAIQPGTEGADGTMTVTYNSADLTFTSAPDGTCTAGGSGASTTETCSYTDLAHSSTSKPFNFTTLKTGSTSATAVVSIGANTATQSFALNIG